MAEVVFRQPDTGPVAPEPTPQADPNRPEWLDPKFESPEKQAQAYAELQAQFTKQAQELAKLKGTAPASGEDTPAESQTSGADQNAEGGETDDAAKQQDQQKSEQDKAAEEAAKAAGIDLTPYQQEFETTGDVSAENRAKIIEGFKKALPDLDWDAAVNEFIEGKKALVANDEAMLLDLVGGKEQYATMIQWASQSLSPDEVAAYNRQIKSKDRHAMQFAVEGLRAKYEKANGRIPTRVSGAAGTPDAVGGYRSTAEMMRDMRDPRYSTDPSFREEVAKKLRASKNI